MEKNRRRARKVDIEGKEELTGDRRTKKIRKRCVEK